MPQGVLVDLIDLRAEASDVALPLVLGLSSSADQVQGRLHALVSALTFQRFRLERKRSPTRSWID